MSRPVHPHDAAAAAAASGLVVHALTARLPDAGEPAPDWVTLFPTTGRVETRDGRIFAIDPERLIAAFRADGLDLPVDVNHATDLAAWTGARADAVGWITDLRVEGAALQARVEWLDEGRQLLSARKYKYGSPSFSARAVADGAPAVAEKLRAWALVTAPALARQPALASLSHPHPEDSSDMKMIAAALGLADGVTEAQCLAALNERLAGAVPKATHEQALADLAATSARLATIETERRDAKVKSVLEAGLAARKLSPAERPAFEKLCATDDGLAQVEALLAARPQLLPDSGLDQRQPADGSALSVTDVAERARKLVAEASARGETLSVTDAVARVAGDRQIAA